MANIEVNITENGTTTLATAGKYCDRNVDVIVAVAGSGGVDLPEEAFNLTGALGYKFYNGNWDWFVEQFGDQITTSAISSASYMFYGSNLTSIPFDLNFEGSGDPVNMMFYQCYDLKEIGKIINLNPQNMSNMFAYCQKLRYAPEFVDFDPYVLLTSSAYGAGSLFNNCCSLRELPSWFAEIRQNAMTSSSSLIYYNAFNSCYALDEAINLPVAANTLTSNQFSNTFKNCYRLKSVTFESGKTAKWKSQTIDLSGYVGWAATTAILNYNSGITTAKKVTDDATYQALKDDPDWYTDNTYYARYNHDSAVETINSLPDTSGYTATGVNTIKFTAANGRYTDGGGIEDLTAEEIAVATAKGWTVTLV